MAYTPDLNHAIALNKAIKGFSNLRLVGSTIFHWAKRATQPALRVASPVLKPTQQCTTEKVILVFLLQFDIMLRKYLALSGACKCAKRWEHRVGPDPPFPTSMYYSTGTTSLASHTRRHRTRGAHDHNDHGPEDRAKEHRTRKNLYRSLELFFLGNVYKYIFQETCCLFPVLSTLTFSTIIPTVYFAWVSTWHVSYA